MNFVLIPFFLAATIIVDDPTKWPFGLVAHYQANVTLNSGMTFNGMELMNATTNFTCRQKSMDVLICSFAELAPRTPHISVKFNRNGIEVFAFEEVMRMREVNVIRMIMKELNIGANLLQHANSLSTFVVNQDYAYRRTCSTLYTVFQDIESPTFTNFCEKRNYVLDVLSLPQRKPGANVIIGKRMNSKWCTGLTDDDPNDGTDTIFEKSVTKMNIGGNVFKSMTKQTAKTREMRKNHSFTTELTTYVELTGVEPATERQRDVENLTYVSSLAANDTRMIYNHVEYSRGRPGREEGKDEIQNYLLGVRVRQARGKRRFTVYLLDAARDEEEYLKILFIS